MQVMLHVGREDQDRAAVKPVIARRGVDLDPAGDDVDRDHPVGGMLYQPAICLEVEEDEGHRSLVDEGDLPVPVADRRRLRAEPLRDRRQIKDMLNARESLSRRLPFTLMFLFHLVPPLDVAVWTRDLAAHHRAVRPTLLWPPASKVPPPPIEFHVVFMGACGFTSVP